MSINTNENQASPRFVKFSALLVYVGLSRLKVMKLMRAGVIPFLKLPASRDYLFDLGEVAKALNKHKGILPQDSTKKGSSYGQ